ncbi:2933_t:CDS:2 [Rhizophagus irregularis]|nr:2933_t:CDS:2 [Rhizophagus irregularis]
MFYTLKDKYILRYPEEDLVKILRDSSYHSEEWEETDPKEECSKGSKDSSGAVAPVDNLKNTNNSSEASAGIDSPKDYLKIKENHQSQVFRIISKPSYRLTKERISNWAHMI